jgi:hypothetical protein
MLSWWSEINSSIWRKNSCLWVGSWKSCPPKKWILIPTNLSSRSKSTPVDGHGSIKWSISPLVSLANELWNVRWSSFKSLNSSGAKWRNLFHQRSLSQSKCLFSFWLTWSLIVKTIKNTVSISLDVKIMIKVIILQKFIFYLLAKHFMQSIKLE